MRSSQLIFPSPTSDARMVDAMGFENEAISNTVSGSIVRRFAHLANAVSLQENDLIVIDHSDRNSGNFCLARLDGCMVQAV